MGLNRESFGFIWGVTRVYTTSSRKKGSDIGGHTFKKIKTHDPKCACAEVRWVAVDNLTLWCESSYQKTLKYCVSLKSEDHLCMDIDLSNKHKY